MFSKLFSKTKLPLTCCGRKLLSKPTISKAKYTSTNTFCTSISHGVKSYSESLENLHNNGTRFGQPTSITHPHLLKANELAIGVTPNEFADRRYRLMEKIQQQCIARGQPNRNIVIIPASMKKYMSDKIPYFFRQNSDFYYLTGCLEPESILVLWNDETNVKSSLFMRPKSVHDELWDGPRTGVDHSVYFFGVEEAYALNDFNKFVEGFVNKSKAVNVWYADIDIQPSVSQSLKKLTSSFHSPMEFLHELRVIKSPAEIDLMRKTCQIASEAVNLTMKESQPGDSEHHIYARVDYHSRMKNASFLAYPPVVASGNNANTIHYINNTQIVKDGDLVLMDAGCEYGGYSSDITRTWPINGKFTPMQELLYEVVFTVQKELLVAVQSVSDATLDQLFDLMCFRLGKYLQEINLVNKSLTDLEAARQASFKFCPHHVSHYLGMDIHDTPLIKRDRPLRPGTVFTIEPGVYIPANCMDAPAEFRGIGIRIEDDVLRTENGIEVLTKDCIKELPKLKELLSN